MDCENRYNGDFSGPYLRYDYPPVGVTKTITDGNGQVLAEYDGDGNLRYNYIYLPPEASCVVWRRQAPVSFHLSPVSCLL